MDLLDAFRKYIDDERLFAPGDRLLLAVSGGLDSVVLTELCRRCGLDVSIVHCNFQLRGAESERDEAFVRRLAEQYEMGAMVARFDTNAYAEECKVSVQVAARDLRYSWFHELLEEGHAKWIVTAHHLDDNIETMLMHFFKGTGITGMRGMLPKQGSIIRPLLFAKKEELKQFAAEAQLQWVEDSSNESDKYTRNYFRHHLIPLVEQMYPSVNKRLADNLTRFREIEMIYRHAIDQRLKKLMEPKGNEVHIPVEKLRKEQPLSTIIYELTEPFGFSPRQADEIQALLDSSTGKYVQSQTHRVLKNRNWLIIAPLTQPEAAHVLIEGEGGIKFAEGAIHLSKIVATENPDQGANIALLDAKNIVYPLLLRRWKAGDYFYPLGMRKKKKVARFLIDTKVPATEKEHIWVLEMDKKIIWIVGRRIDDRFKLDKTTKEVLRIEFTRPDGPSR